MVCRYIGYYSEYSDWQLVYIMLKYRYNTNNNNHSE